MMVDPSNDFVYSTTSTAKSGETFQGSVFGYRHTVRYEAKDNDGLIGYCFFEFEVKGMIVT